MDHGVVIVGADTDPVTGLDYWLVKNSWGSDWGLKGFVKLARNMNTCGLNQASSYPVVPRLLQRQSKLKEMLSSLN